MLTYLRYALATICFALSLMCLGLWWRSYSFIEQVDWKSDFHGEFVCALCGFGGGELYYFGPGEHRVKVRWQVHSTVVNRDRVIMHEHSNRTLFGANSESVWFPLWYPALVFTLAGVGILRLGRRFTLRSAIIATTVVAGLLGVVVTL
jgi:hypothetical protein